MCLQDVQLARAVRETVYPVSTTAAGQVAVLGRDESRVGLFFLGPTAGTVSVQIGGTGLEWTATSFGITGGHNVRSISLTDDGYHLTEPVWITASEALSLTVVEYCLPLAPDHLAILAKNGRW